LVKGLLVLGVIGMIASAAHAQLISEGFEGGVLPAGWEANDTEGTSSGTDLISTLLPRTGTYGLRIDAASDEAVTPLLTTPGNLTFWVNCSGTTDINIDVSTDKIDWSTRVVDHLEVVCVGDYQQATVSLADYTDVYVKITRGGTAIHYIDDVVVTDRGGGGGDPVDPEQTLDVTNNVPINITISAVVTLDLETSDGVPGLDFSNYNGVIPFVAANDHIIVNHESNFINWGIELYTDNFDVNGGVGITSAERAIFGDQVGGIIDKTAGQEQKIGLGWSAYLTPTSDPAAQPHSVEIGTMTYTSRWVYVKDKSDADWDNRAGYCNIAFGNGTSVTNVVNPFSPTGVDNPLNPTDPFYLFIETTGTVDPGTFDGAIHLDIYHK
ncbi:hypothetical protein ACFLTD_03940, partial [Elusimicrobiota bacterium]